MLQRRGLAESRRNDFFSIETRSSLVGEEEEGEQAFWARSAPERRQSTARKSASKGSVTRMAEEWR
jgi:hypothetical protein